MHRGPVAKPSSLFASFSNLAVFGTDDLPPYHLGWFFQPSFSIILAFDVDASIVLTVVQKYLLDFCS